MTGRSFNLVRKSALVLAFIFVLTACGGNEIQTTTSSPTHTPQLTLTPLLEIELNVTLPDGDPERGFPTIIRYGCQGCHVGDQNPENAPRFASSDGLPNIL